MMKPNAKEMPSRSASVMAGVALPARTSVATTEPGPTRTSAAVPSASASAFCAIERIPTRPPRILNRYSTLSNRCRERTPHPDSCQCHGRGGAPSVRSLARPGAAAGPDDRGESLRVALEGRPAGRGGRVLRLLPAAGAHAGGVGVAVLAQDVQVGAEIAVGQVQQLAKGREAEAAAVRQPGQRRQHT